MRKKTVKKAAPRKPGRPAGSTSVRSNTPTVNRILVGVRIEPRLVKVMKAMAELHDCALGELIERVFWSAMDGQSAFSEKSGRLSNEVRQQVASLKQVYGVDYKIEELSRPRDRDTTPAKKKG